MSGQLTEGWGFPVTSRKCQCHYFREDGMSLCGKRGFYYGRLQPETGKTSPDDCVACVKELVRLGRRARPEDKA